MARTSRLDTLLRIRRIEEDRAKGVLAAANAERHAADRRLDAVSAAYADASAASPPDAEAELAFIRRLESVTALARGVMVAETDRVEAAQAAARATEDVRRASMKTQGLERLVDKYKAAHEAEILAADQRTAEESSAAKKSRGRS